MFFERFMAGLRRTALHALAALAGGGALALGYATAMIWFATGAAPTRTMWWVIGPLSGAVAVLTAAVVVMWNAVTVIAVVRALEFMARAAEQQERRATNAAPAARRLGNGRASAPTMGRPAPRTVVLAPPAARAA